MTQPINDYTVVSASSWGRLVIRVNERIVEGWQPQGGLVLTDYARSDETGPTWAQAMVKGPGIE